MKPRHTAAGALAGLALLLSLSGTGRAAEEGVPSVTFTVKAFQVEGESPIPDAEAQAVLAPFLGEQEGLESIQAASQALERALQGRGFTFYRVVVPPQRARGGVFRLRVLGFKVDRIQVRGNKHFSDANILTSLPALKVGASPNSLDVAQSLALANEHPAKRVAVFLRESDEPGRLSARVEARDSRPWQLFASIDNTGTPDTGHKRISLGYQHSNLWDLDHIVTLSYTTSPGHYSDVKQKGVFYRIPLYDWHSEASLYYTQSEVDQGRIDTFDVSGAGIFKGLSLTRTLRPRGEFTHKLRISLDDRFFIDNSRLGGVSLPVDTDVRSRPIALRYLGGWESDEAQAEYYAEYARNWVTGPDNDGAAYAANGASLHWEVFRAGGSLDWGNPLKWRLRGRLAAQYAPQRLISGEQFGLGGVHSIRGFQERETAGDSGYSLNLEVWAPPFKNGLQLLGFVDLGVRHLRRDPQSVPGTGRVDQERNDTLASVGLGLRWHWRDHAHLSVDLARVVDDNNDFSNGEDGTQAGHDKIHVSLFLRY